MASRRSTPACECRSYSVLSASVMCRHSVVQGLSTPAPQRTSRYGTAVGETQSQRRSISRRRLGLCCSTLIHGALRPKAERAAKVLLARAAKGRAPARGACRRLKRRGRTSSRRNVQLHPSLRPRSQRRKRARLNASAEADVFALDAGTGVWTIHWPWGGYQLLAKTVR